jgi:hypothetical protein
MGKWGTSDTRRVIRALGRNVAESGTEVDLTELVELRGELDASIAQAVAGLRARDCSWQNLADALGVTKSAVYQRYGKGLSNG